MGYQILTTLILAVHFGYLGYLVTGGFLAWRWPRTVWSHSIVAMWGIVVTALDLTCPLTWAEDWSRQQAGEPPLTSGFIDRYIEGVLYPERYATVVQILVALLVAASWAGLAYRRRSGAYQR